MQEVIQFAYEKKLFLLADEVCKHHKRSISFTPIRETNIWINCIFIPPGLSECC